ncbi:MAG TPA: magnesium transporter [Candidatus Binatia bacterium]|nr:magnesium transporter [Candidatus Binatia bacterium]
MSAPAPIDAETQDLLRAVRARVPVDAAELLAQEPPERIESVLRALPQDLALRIAFELPEALRPATDDEQVEVAMPGSVAELTEPPHGVIEQGTTIAAAIERLRHAADAGETTYLYVCDDLMHLRGLVVIRDLLLADPKQRVDEIMIRQPFALKPDQPIHEAVNAALRRHYPVYPVVDDDGKLLGMVRGWRLSERQALEISAQPGTMVGASREERVDTTAWEAFKQRHPWLQLNLITAFLAAFVVGSFEDTISRIVALAAFLPVLAGQSGNTGCQALAITLRGLTLGDVDQHPVRALLKKESLLGAMNGLLTGFVAGAAMWWSQWHNPQAPLLALVIVLAMVGACTMSGVSGVLIPLLLRRLGADPATASAIFLTTVTDVVGMGLMLTLATVLVL